MKVVAFNGSPRKAGNTRHLLDAALGELAASGIETMKNLGSNFAWLLGKLHS